MVDRQSACTRETKLFLEALPEALVKLLSIVDLDMERILKMKVPIVVTDRRNASWPTRSLQGDARPRGDPPPSDHKSMGPWKKQPSGLSRDGPYRAMWLFTPNRLFPQILINTAMSCVPSKTVSHGLSISALVTSAVALVLGVLLVVARRKGQTHGQSKAFVGFTALVYLAALALILASGFIIYGRKVASCQRKKDEKKSKKLLKHGPHDDDYGHHHEDMSVTAQVLTIIGAVLILALLIVVCANFPFFCLILAIFD